MHPNLAGADHGVFITFSRWAPTRLATDPGNTSDRRRLSPPRCRLWHRWSGSHRYRGVAWPSARRLVFVCTDNTSIGPYAERGAHGLGLPAVSLGLRATPGNPVAAAAVLAAAGRGVGLAGHRARVFDANAIEPGDLVICFTPGDCAQVAARLGRPARDQVVLLALGERASPADDGGIDRCYRRIDEALALIRSAWEQRAVAINERKGRTLRRT
jgi:protein-tyrosine-phosphatase